MADTKNCIQMQNLGSAVYAAADAAWRGGEDRNRQYEFAGHVLRLNGTVIEPIYEGFEGTCSVSLDDEVLYGKEASNVAAYHNEVYNYGKYDTVADMVDGLVAEYGAVALTETSYQRPVSSPRMYDRRWVNPDYAKKMEAVEAERKRYAEHSAERREAERLVWKDEGSVVLTDKKTGETKKCQRVVFARACDGRDFTDIAAGKGVANPYLVNRKVNGKTYHDMLVDEGDYRRLVDASNYDGMQDNGRFTGIVNARMKNGRPNLSPYDFENQILGSGRRFDEKAHNRFVKASLAYRYQSAEKLTENVTEAETENQPQID